MRFKLPRIRGKGKYISAWGYIIVRAQSTDDDCPFLWNDGRCYEHVLKVWRSMKNGRWKGLYYDPAKHEIHHKDLDKTNNRLLNLEVMTIEEHELLTLKYAREQKNNQNVKIMEKHEELLEELTKEIENSPSVYDDFINMF
jgi:hypothetical protein